MGTTKWGPERMQNRGYVAIIVRACCPCQLLARRALCSIRCSMWPDCRFRNISIGISPPHKTTGESLFSRRRLPTHGLSFAATSRTTSSKVIFSSTWALSRVSNRTPVNRPLFCVLCSKANWSWRQAASITNDEESGLQSSSIMSTRSRRPSGSS